VAVLLAVGEVWGMCDVIGQILRAVEKPRGAAVGVFGFSFAKDRESRRLVGVRRGEFSFSSAEAILKAQFPFCRGRLPARLCAKSSSTDKQYAT